MCLLLHTKYIQFIRLRCRRLQTGCRICFTAPPFRTGASDCVCVCDQVHPRSQQDHNVRWWMQVASLSLHREHAVLVDEVFKIRFCWRLVLYKYFTMTAICCLMLLKVANRLTWWSVSPSVHSILQQYSGYMV